MKGKTLRFTAEQRDTLQQLGHQWVRDRLDEYRRAYLEQVIAKEGRVGRRARLYPAEREALPMEGVTIRFTEEQLDTLGFVGARWVRDGLDEVRRIQAVLHRWGEEMTPTGGDTEGGSGA